MTERKARARVRARATATTGVLHFVQDDGVWRWIAGFGGGSWGLGARRMDGGGMIAL